MVSLPVCLQRLRARANALNEEMHAAYQVPLDDAGVALLAWYDVHERGRAAQAEFERGLADWQASGLR